MRIRGQVIGARATTATRRSVIFRSDGLELVLVFCTAASSVWSAQKAAPRPAARKLRRSVNFVVTFFMLAILRDILGGCRLSVVGCRPVLTDNWKPTTDNRFLGDSRESRRFYGATGADAAGRRDREIEGAWRQHRGAGDRQLPRRPALQAVAARRQGRAQGFQAD